MSGAFESIRGQTRIVESLKAAIATGKVSHAYIFSGQPGSGKSLLADSFSKALQCETAEACGACLSCRVFDSGNHPDMFYITPQGKSLGVDDVRERILKNMETRPYRYRYKIFVIDKAHTMTAQAQNALLKTIEEPAGYGIFLLLAEGLGAFLPTVLSRCLTYKLGALGHGEVYDRLRAEGADEAAARLAAVYAQGNIGRGLRLVADDEFIELREKTLEIMQRLTGADIVTVFRLAKEFDAFKERIQEALDIAYLWYRDLLVLKTAEAGFIIQTDKTRQLSECTTDVFAGLAAVDAAKRRLRHYANFQLTIEVMLLDIWSAARKLEEKEINI